MLEESAGELEEKFGGAALAIGGTAAAVAALGAIAVGVTHHMMELAQSIDNTAAATGLSRKEVQEYSELAKEMGLDAESVEMAFSRLEGQLGEYITTGGRASSGSQLMTRTLLDLNVQLEAAPGKARHINDVLIDFYEVLSKIPDQSTRTVLEMEVLGTRGKVIAEMFEEARRRGRFL